MGLLFVMRTGEKISAVKEIIISMNKQLEADSAFLGSGYITEYVDKKHGGIFYFASAQVNSSKIELKNSFPNNLTIVGVHSNKSSYWYDNYRRFVLNICKRTNPIHVTAYYEKNGRWHAKIYILLKAGVPIAAVIGSSNLTCPAFWDNSSGFNIEADLVIWNRAYDKRMNIILETLPKKSIISATINPLWEGDCEEKRLEELYGYIVEKLPEGKESTKDSVVITEFTL